MLTDVVKHFDIYDVISWATVVVVFTMSAALSGGDLLYALGGSLGIVLLMQVISYSIGMILAVLQNHERLGELSGYITNGPELLVVIVGLLNHQWKFGISVPLGSNIANPILLLLAAALSGFLIRLWVAEYLRSWLLILATISLVGLFYLLENPGDYWIWLGVTLVCSLILYQLKPKDELLEESEEPMPVSFLPLAIALLVASGYALDPVVSFTAEHSNLAKGLIGFFILSFLTSWPEFRAMLSLFKMNRPRAAWLNCIVSNITNLWLGVGGAIIGLLSG